MKNAMDLWRRSLFDDFLAPFQQETRFSPAWDIEETEDHYQLSVDLPGVSKDDVKVEVVDNQLVVTGERKNKNQYMTFQKSFSLPASIDAEKVEADFTDGVLQLAIPKPETAKPKLVRIGESSVKRLKHESGEQSKKEGAEKIA